MAQQALEAVDRAALGGEFAGALAIAAAGERASVVAPAPPSPAALRVIIIKQDRFEALAHVPFDMAGEHAEEDMSARPRVDRQDVQIDGLEAAKGALDPSQAVLGADHVICRQGSITKAGAKDIKAVELRLRGDAGLVAVKAEAVFGDGDIEVFGELAAVFDAADGAGDLGLSLAAASGLVGQFGQRRLGGAQQIRALARALLGQQRVAADQPGVRRKIPVR